MAEEKRARGYRAPVAGVVTNSKAKPSTDEHQRMVDIKPRRRILRPELSDLSDSSEISNHDSPESLAEPSELLKELVKYARSMKNHCLRAIMELTKYMLKKTTDTMGADVLQATKKKYWKIQSELLEAQYLVGHDWMDIIDKCMGDIENV